MARARRPAAVVVRPLAAPAPRAGAEVSGAHAVTNGLGAPTVPVVRSAQAAAMADLVVPVVAPVVRTARAAALADLEGSAITRAEATARAAPVVLGDPAVPAGRVVRRKRAGPRGCDEMGPRERSVPRFSDLGVRDRRSHGCRRT